MTTGLWRPSTYTYRFFGDLPPITTDRASQNHGKSVSLCLKIDTLHL